MHKKCEKYAENPYATLHYLNKQLNQRNIAFLHYSKSMSNSSVPASEVIYIETDVTKTQLERLMRELKKYSETRQQHSAQSSPDCL